MNPAVKTEGKIPGPLYAVPRSQTPLILINIDKILTNIGLNYVEKYVLILNCIYTIILKK